MGELINFTAHGLVADDTIMLGNLVGGEGLEQNLAYFVLASGLTANAFKVSLTSGGAAIAYTTDITDGVIVRTDVYQTLVDGIQDPPAVVPTPSVPTLTSADVAGIVRLRVVLNDTAEAKVRAWEVQVTNKFAAADADWTTPFSATLPDGSTELSLPALGSTVYAVRIRAQDVYGNYSAYCADTLHTTQVGNDSLAASIALLANDVQDGIITETKIADNAISTPKLQAGAVTADILAATIVLASLLKTADTGRRIELDIEGVRLIDADDALVVNIPTNGDPVYVKGDINAASLTSLTSAEFRTAASLAGSTTMTLQNGVSAPAVVPTVTASVDSLTLTTTPGSVAAAAGIAYDSAASASYWIACDPTVSPFYVAQEFNAVTGALIGSIAATGSTETVTGTRGATTHVSDSAQAQSGSTSSHVAVNVLMPTITGGTRITKVSAYFAGYLGSCSARVCVWDDVSGVGNLLAESSTFTASDASFSTGNSAQYNRSLSSPVAVASGDTIYAGFRHTSSGEGFQWDRDEGSGKNTYLGDGTDANGSGWSLDSTARKANIYVTYEYDVDSRLETLPNIGIASDGTHVYTLDTSGVVWKYLISTGAYVAASGIQTAITGTKSKAGLFYDATSGELNITTTSGTGAGVYPKIVRVNTTTLAVSATVYTAATGSTFSGTTDTFRGGARLNDPLNASAATYWLATTSAVHAYTFSGTTLTNTANRSFGQSATVGEGLTHDGTVFRGYDTAAPTKVWKFSAWDFTTTSTTLRVGYSWRDSVGTTHETAMGPRASLTIRRRERVQVQNPAIPTGGVEDPNNARIYMLQNATDTGAGTFWLQVTDALTSRYITTYTGSGTADGAGTAFDAGTPAELKSAGTGWSLYGSGRMAFGGAAFPGSPTTDDLWFHTTLDMWFFYNGTRWLSTQVFEVQLGSGSANASYSATTSNVAWQAIDLHGGSDAWLLDTIAFYYVNTGGTALGASHSWALAFEKAADSSTVFTSIGTTALNSGTNGSRKTVTAVNALLNNGTVHNGFRTNLQKVGTPSSTYVSGKVRYRVVAT